MENDMYPNVLFEVIERTSPTVPFIAWIRRVDGKELPPGFGSNHTRNNRREWSLLWETSEMPGKWHFSDAIPPRVIPLEEKKNVTMVTGPPQFTVSITEREEYFSFQPQRRIPTIASRANWEDYMDSHNTPAAAYEACDRSQKAFGENVEWRVVLKRTTVDVVHRTS
jgi:hypothetical protein